ncbi:MAG: ornithine cyclodeaminase family protein [Desulfotignum sp.]|nr:ornithine cyclodeaminase family protein [Desulfotignum sp.]
MRFFNKQTIDSIPLGDMQKAVEHAYTMLLDNACHMPDRMHVPHGDNTLLLMPCFGKDHFATKLVTVFPKAARSGLPVVNGMVVLADNLTGQPLAIMDGAALTARRTGAVGGVAVDRLSLETVHTAGIIGAGIQGRSQADYLLFNRQVTTLWVADLDRKAAESMARDLEKTYPHVTCRVAKTARHLVDDSQVVIAATTSRQPVFEAEPADIKGKTFISIGSFTPQMKEFPDAVIAGADAVYVDTLFAAKESGDLCIPLANKVVTKNFIQPFAEVIRNPVETRNKTYFFKSVGMALFDLTAASAVFTWGKEKNLGQILDV